MTIPYGVSVVAGLASVITIIGAYIYQTKKKEITPRYWKEIGIIKKIYFYPLRSGHQVEMQRAECTHYGLKQTEEDEEVFQLRDRFLIVYSEKEHELRTARTYPKLLSIDVAVHDGSHLAVDAPTMRTLYVNISTEENEDAISVKCQSGEKVFVFDCGDEAALWFSRYILEKDSGLRLGYRMKNGEADICETQSLFMEYYRQLANSNMKSDTDLTNMLLVNQASVNDLNQRLGNSTVTADYFRPNIIIDGEAIEPYSENDWEWIKIGEVIFRNMTYSSRPPPVSENNGISGKTDSLKPFLQFRPDNGTKEPPILGIQLDVRRSGSISVADKVFLPKTK